MKKKVETKVFCENVKYLREKNNLSRTKMAKKLGITIKSLDMIESGKLPPRMSCEILVYLYHNFGISVTEIFTPIEK